MNIKVYSTPTCHFCVELKEFLKERAVPFEDIDVTKDQKQLEEMVQKSNQMGVPVTEIDGRIIIGFDRDEFEKIINSQ